MKDIIEKIEIIKGDITKIKVDAIEMLQIDHF